MLDEVRAWKPSITLFGGEPMLHPQCLGIIRAVKERGMHCLMITNGSFVEPRAAELVESGLDELNVSIDGRGGVHDAIRQSDGLYERIMSGLSALRYSRQRRRKPLINIQCTITRFNQHALHEMAEVVREVGADSLTLHHLIFLDETLLRVHKEYARELDGMSGNWEGFLGSAGIDVTLLQQKIRFLRNKLRQVKFDVYPNFSDGLMREYYAHPVPAERPRCKSPWSCAYVFPDGEVRPCLNFSYSFGSAASSSVGELWNGCRARAYRSKLKEEKSFPACTRCTELFRY